ncbi:MAG: phage resistance protein, partial [Candidatus Hydrogenedentes bacterium]|nr:phage resistance protein [Candidatus Hydrogenedentota bacterium]
NTAAVGIPELASVIAKHNDWLQGKKFLLVPYHMIGAQDMESGVLGGYADFVRNCHPEGTVPGVYRAEGLFQDARNLRESMNDTTFFQELNGEGDDGGWGELEAAWDGERFETAMRAEPGDEERSQLVGVLTKTFFSSYSIQANDYLSLDKGLSVISKHAKSLDYDAVILFLDELILWLASHATDLKFINQECQKVAKLVEAQTADRPIPLVSLVARQRDLRDLIGDSVPGANRLNFDDTLGWQEGRFHTTTLEDRNLPAIAEKRVLRCRTESAKKELDAAFEQAAKIREQVMNILLTSDGDRAMFRKVYPFSPALIQTLIAVSSVLQRERTALKVMMQLLVDGRETLHVGDIVPVGDLFDVIAHGDEAFSPEMALHFNNAKNLYHQKLLPVLEKTHGRWEELKTLSFDDPKRVAFRNDDRLIKTLLLAALVPQVESLRALNAEKLAALNHGTIKTPIPGKEGSEVLRRCREWAASAGELRIGEEVNPTISLQLSGVDTEGIIEQARKEDNQGNRIRLIRTLLFEELDVTDTSDFFLNYDFLWKNTLRRCELLFKNIRELPEASLENKDSDWKLIIDWPFDEIGHGPRDDLSKLQAYRENHLEGAKTLCWVPAFFSQDAMKDLGMLVILQHILSGERFDQYAKYLSATDRQAAKSLLENQRSVLRNRVKIHLEAAYGLEALNSGSLDTAHDLELNERFASLFPGFEPQVPAAAKISTAMEAFLGQALAHEFPAAPKFEEEIKTSKIKKVYEEIQEAARAEDGRIFVEKNKRILIRNIANPLSLGEMGYDATHFVLGQHWKNHFTRKAAKTSENITVSVMRRWIDEPRAMGIPKEVQNLIILTFADQTSRSFFLHGGPYTASITDLPDECELREQKLPNENEWKIVVQRAGSIFGISVSPLINAVNLQSLVEQIRAKQSNSISNCQAYTQKLAAKIKEAGISPQESARKETAEATVLLLVALQDASDDAIVNTLVSAKIATSEEAMGGCIAKAAALENVLDIANWEILSALSNLPDSPKAKEILSSVREVLKCDEHVVPLHARLTEAQSKATRLLTKSVKVLPEAPVSTPSPPPVTKPTSPGKRIVQRGNKENLDIVGLEEVLHHLKEEGQNGDICINVSWIIEEDKS